MSHRLNWLFVVLLFTAVTANASTTGKLSGTVRDADTGELLVGVSILIEDTHFGAATDLDGFYYILGLPPGQYDVRAQYMGYRAEIRTGVTIRSDFTTNLDFSLSASAVELEAVEFVAERPAIQRDLTSNQQGFQSSEISTAPVESLDEIINLQAGINELGNEASGLVEGSPGDGMHIRGGRENETLFLIDGVKVGDDIYGGSRYIQNSSGGTINEMKTIIGTFNAEYGGKTAGVVSVVTKDGGDKYDIAVGGYTDHFGVESLDKNTYQGEFSLSGPVPGLKDISFFVNAQSRTTDGRSDLMGYEIQDWKDSNGQVGRFTPGAEVPLSWKDDWNTMGKLTWQISNGLKLASTYFASHQLSGKYKHEYRYVPYAQPYNEMHNTGLIVRLNHNVNSSKMYDLFGSYQTTDFFYGLDEDISSRILYGQRMTFENYYYSGAPNVWNSDSSRTWQLGGSFSNQINKRHLLKSGFEWRLLNIIHRQDPAGASGVVEIDGEIYEQHYAYSSRWPVELSGYVQDKMEFEQIGMIMNLGARVEYWDPQMSYMEDPDDPYNTPLLDVDPKLRVSPRFGISYPVSNQAAFHLAYGHFYQMPSYMQLMSGFNDVGYLAGRPNLGSEPGTSNPNAEPEKTVSYETGVQFEVMPGLTMNVTGYYREMSSLMGVRWMSGGGGYIYIDNVDFGNSKGVELRLEKRFSDMWSSRVNYTWSTSNISTSSPATAIQKNTFIAYKTFPADWDRPHDLSIMFFFATPSNWSASMIYSLRSGRPYSVLAEELNTERMPMESSADIKVTKALKFKGLDIDLYVKVNNIFNTRNILNVYSLTGKWDDDGESGTPHDLDAVPTRISEGRTARIGFKFNM